MWVALSRKCPSGTESPFTLVSKRRNKRMDLLSPGVQVLPAQPHISGQGPSCTLARPHRSVAQLLQCGVPSARMPLPSPADGTPLPPLCPWLQGGRARLTSSGRWSAKRLTPKLPHSAIFHKVSRQHLVLREARSDPASSWAAPEGLL